MATKRKLRKGTCKNCGKTFRRSTSGDLIKAVHAHYVKVHPAALSRKIKRGMRKRSSNALGNNPAWLTALLTGIFPPANIPSIKAQYAGMSLEERSAAKQMITGLTLPLGGEASAIALAVMKALDFYAKSK